jgi:hypothetical protein
MDLEKPRPRPFDRSTIDRSTIDHRPSTIDHRPSTIDHRPSTIDHRPIGSTLAFSRSSFQSFSSQFKAFQSLSNQKNDQRYPMTIQIVTEPRPENLQPAASKPQPPARHAD